MKNILNKYLIKKNPCVVLSLLLITTFLIRYYLTSLQIITLDGILYIKIAKGINFGNLQGVTDYGFFNLYSLLITLFQLLLHDWEFSGKMVSVVFGSLTIIPLFFLVRGLFNQNTAIVSAILYGIHPRFVEYSSDILREPVFWFFSIVSLWLAWEGVSRKKCFLFVLSSISTGFAMFTRAEGAMVFLIVILWLLWFFLNGKLNRKKALLYASIFLFSFPIVVSPGLILLKNKLNRWEVGLSISKIPQLIYSDNQPLKLEQELQGRASRQLQAFYDLSIRYRYLTFLVEVLYKFFKSFNVILFLLFLCGVYKRRFVPYSQSDIIVLIWFSVAFIGSYLYLTKTYYFGTRHGLLMAFPALAWAGSGFFEIRERIIKWCGGVKLFRRYVHFCTLFLIILIMVILVPQTMNSFKADKVELKSAGIVLKNMGFTNMVFIAQPTLMRVGFYADAEFVPLPDTIDNNALKELVTQYRAKLLIVDERTIDDYVPGVRKIIEELKFEKLTIPEIAQYRKYSFSIYKTQ
jgi:4-amino-4-deoxy-L-arabinose transferase-like glycosyltransferase